MDTSSKFWKLVSRMTWSSDDTLYNRKGFSNIPNISNLILQNLTVHETFQLVS